MSGSLYATIIDGIGELFREQGLEAEIVMDNGQAKMVAADRGRSRLSCAWLDGGDNSVQLAVYTSKLQEAYDLLNQPKFPTLYTDEEDKDLGYTLFWVNLDVSDPELLDKVADARRSLKMLSNKKNQVSDPE